MARVAIAGLGKMGRKHFDACARVAPCDLVAIADTSPSALVGAHLASSVATYLDHREMLARERPEVVVVATPAATHCDVAIDALRAGAHVLVEKPVALSASDAWSLTRVSMEVDRALGVGFVERFNPAVRELVRRIASGEHGAVRRIRARRLAAFPGADDVGVTMDLAIHDLDVVCLLVGRSVLSVDGEASWIDGDPREAEVRASLSFEGDVRASIEASWTAPGASRELVVATEGATFFLDYAARALAVVDDPTAYEAGSPPSGARLLPVLATDPLGEQLAAFLRARAGADGVATGLDGVRATGLAEAIVESAHLGRPVRVLEESFGICRSGFVATAPSHAHDGDFTHGESAT